MAGSLFFLSSFEVLHKKALKGFREGVKKFLFGTSPISVTKKFKPYQVKHVEDQKQVVEGFVNSLEMQK